MSKRLPIDLQDCNAYTVGIAGFVQKAQAAKFAKKCGWKVSDTKLVRFRWQELWVLAYEVPGELIVLKKDKTTVSLPWDAKYVSR